MPLGKKKRCCTDKDKGNFAVSQLYVYRYIRSSLFPHIRIILIDVTPSYIGNKKYKKPAAVPHSKKTRLKMAAYSFNIIRFRTFNCLSQKKMITRYVGIV